MKIRLLLVFFLMGMYPVIYAQSTFELTGPESLCAGSSATLTAANCAGTLQWDNGSTATTLTVSPAKTTVYYATCTVGATKTVSSISPIVLPALQLSSNTGQCFTAGTTTLTANGAPNGSSLIWKKDGNVINGASSTTYTPTQTGNYTAELTHQGEWTFQNPLPHGHTFNDVHFADANVGVVVGNFGSIARTTDGGATWTTIVSGTTQNLQSVHFVNSSIGWIVGIGYTLLKTTDGGLTWNSVSTGNTSWEYEEITFVDANNGWIVVNSASGTLLRTTNGGTTWAVQNTGINQQKDIHFTSSLNGWVVGENGIVKKTADGGQNWTVVNLGTTNSLRDVFFVSPTHGWIVSYSNVYRTTDGGTTWNSTSNWGESLFFTSTTEGWLASGSSIYKSTDGGATWQSGNTLSSSVLAIHANTSSNPIAVGTGATVLKTFAGDTGIYWLNVFGQGARQNFSRIEPVSATVAFAVGGNSLIYKTANGGKTWLPQYSNTFTSLNGVDFVDANTGWVVGDNSTIGKTTDGGTTWTTQNAGSGTTFRKVQFIDANTGWISAGNNFLKTTDGGSSWNISGVGSSINDFHFIDQNIGWVVSNNGALLKTTDGGQNWATVTSGTTNYLSLVYFTDANNGWISGYPIIRHTTDGGNTWTTQTISGYSVATLSSISFVNPNEGWASINYYNTVLKTMDGGNTWIPQSLSLGNNFVLDKVAFADNNSGWGLSYGGIIMKYTKIATPCVSNTLTLVVPPAAPNITSSNPQNVLCSGSSVTLTAMGCSNTLQWSTGATTSSITVNPTVSTTYLAYCRDAQGCQSSAAYGLGIMTTPQLTSQGTLCADNNLLLTATGLSTASLRWLRDGNPLTDAINTTYYANQAGTYSAENKSPGTWTLQNPLPTGDTYYDVQFLDAQTGYAVGDRGMIYKTTDGGGLWVVQNSGTTNNLSDVHFINTTTGYVAGRNILLKTTDGGTTWQSLPIGNQGSWHGVFFTDANNGCIVGNYSGIRRTTDGGITWTTATGVPDTAIFSLYFTSFTTGWAVGINGTILKTTNGGAAWTTQTSGTTNQIYAVHFSDANNGWATFNSYTNTVLKTTNGGSTWTTVTLPINTYFGDIQFITPTQGYIVGNSYILSTQDGGISWSSKYNAEFTQLLGIHFNSSAEGYAVGYAGGIFKTTDGGNSWQTYGSGVRGEINDLFFVTPQNGWAVGSNGLITNTTDGGATWKKQASNTSQYLSGVHFVNAATGWAVGWAIVNTTNGGNTWVVQNGSLSSQLIDVYFTNPTTGWAVGSNGLIMATTNGGTTWTTQTAGITQSLRKVYFLNSSEGWAVGNNGTILKTTNGGATWLSQSSGTTQQLQSIFFTDANNGWVGGYNNALLHTTNGGATWTAITNIGQDFSAYDMQFFNANEGWFSSYQGAFYTQDAGATWALAANSSGINKISFADANNGWGIASPNKIFKLGKPTSPCVSTAVVVQENQTAAPTVTASTPNALCEGESITLTATGCSGTLQWSTGANTSSITVTPRASTSYTASCLGANGCKNQTFMGVAVMPKPRLDTTITGTCQTINFKAENVPSSATLVWKKDGTTISNLNGQSYSTTNIGSYTIETNSAGAWLNQTGAITPNSLSDVTFANASLGLAVGSNGVILKTNDGGTTWQTQSSGTGQGLNRLTMVSALVGWAVGNSGTVLKTSDGGESWQKQKLSTGGYVGGVSFADENKGWLIANGNTIYTTANGGITWTSPLNLGISLSDIKAISMTTAWAVGNGGNVLKTTNGGSSWSFVNVGTTQQLTGITFSDASNGWIVGANGTLLRTSDGGSSWALQNSGISNQISRVQFVDSNTGWFRAAGSLIYKTANGGASWTPSGAGNNAIGYPTAFFMKNTNEGVFVGSNGAISQTTDGTATWQSIGGMAQTSYNDVHFTNATTGFAIGYGFVAKTTDGGKKWVQKVLPSNGYYDVFFVNATHGWVVGYNNSGPGGSIMATTDGGQTWNPQSTGIINNYPTLYSTHFLDTSTGWVVGSNGAILKTTNGGTTWVQKTSGTTQELRSVHFINANQGWAVGSNGTILVTSNGGDTWAAQVSGTTNTFNSVQFVNSNIGWAVANTDDGVYKTTNGGTAWVKQDLDPTAYNYTYRVQFLDQNNGWVLGADNAFSTTDGGTTWEKSYHFNTSSGMYFTDATTGWVVGSRIMRFQSADACVSVPVNVTTSGASTLQTVKSGNWNDPTVWSCGQVPTITQNALIKSPHIINIIVGQPAKCKNILIETGSVFDCPTGASFEASSWN